MLVVLHTYQDILHLPGLQSCIQFSGRCLFGRSAVSRGIAHAPESTGGSEWAVALSTLVFGLWHMGLAMSITNNNILAAIASSIALQGIIGLWFAILFVRTHNLLVPAAFHSLWDVLGV